jgi:hypothetical protein
VVHQSQIVSLVIISLNYSKALLSTQRKGLPFEQEENMPISNPEERDQQREDDLNAIFSFRKQRLTWTMTKSDQWAA